MREREGKGGSGGEGSVEKESEKRVERYGLRMGLVWARFGVDRG